MEPKSITVEIPDELLQKTNIVAGTRDESRSVVVTEALETYLTDLEAEKAFKQKLVGHYLDREIGDDALDVFLQRRDAEAVRSARQILDDAESLAERMSDD
jgi:predicted esterase